MVKLTFRNSKYKAAWHLYDIFVDEHSNALLWTWCRQVFKDLKTIIELLAKRRHNAENSVILIHWASFYQSSISRFVFKQWCCIVSEFSRSWCTQKQLTKKLRVKCDIKITDWRWTQSDTRECRQQCLTIKFEELVPSLKPSECEWCFAALSKHGSIDLCTNSLSDLNEGWRGLASFKRTAAHEPTCLGMHFNLTTMTGKYFIFEQYLPF